MDGIVGKQSANLVKQCLLLMNEAGATVAALTCDEAPANNGMLHEPGCNFRNVDNLKTAFPYPVTHQPTAAFLDPCHILELVRNALAHKGSFVDQHGRTVAWKHFVARDFGTGEGGQGG